MSENNQASGSNGLMDLIIAIVVIIAFIFLCKYIWHGMVWAFNGYVDLLRVN